MWESVRDVVGVLSDARQQASNAYPFATFLCVLTVVFLVIALALVLGYRLGVKKIDADERKSFQHWIRMHDPAGPISVHDAAKLRHRMLRKRP